MYHYAGNNPVRYTDPNGNAAIDLIQGGLDIAGCIPVVGEAADGINAVISLCRGDYVGAALSATSMIPVIGDAIGKGGKVTRQVVKHSDDIVAVGKQIVKHGDDIVAAGKQIAKHADDAADAARWTNHGFKHFPQKNKTWSEIIKSTKNGPAKYSKSISDIEKFEREAWETGTIVKNGKNWKVKKYDGIIGASGGKETQYIRIENNSGTIHGHPITESEYMKLLKE